MFVRPSRLVRHYGMITDARRSAAYASNVITVFSEVLRFSDIMIIIRLVPIMFLVSSPDNARKKCLDKMQIKIYYFYPAKDKHKTPLPR